MRACVVAFSMMLFSAGCAGRDIVIRDVDEAAILPLGEVRSGDIEAGSAGRYVFYVEKGERIPVKISVDTDVVDNVEEEISLVALQRIYFMIDVLEDLSGAADPEELAKRMKVYISLDARRWALVHRRKAVKEVLGWEKVFFSFGLGVSASEGPHARVDVAASGGG